MKGIDRANALREEKAPQAVERLLVMLEREWNLSFNWALGFARGCFLNFVIGIAAFIALATEVHWFLKCLVGLVSVVIVYYAFVSYGYTNGMNDTPYARSKRVEVIRKILCRKLEDLQTEHHLNAAQHIRLIHVLARCSDPSWEFFSPSLSIALLQAIEKVGDGRALPEVERVANTEAVNEHHERIRAAAERCLTVLRERVEQERLGHTLLRPASAPDTPAVTLLRPAQGPGESDPERLLRPAEPQEEPGLVHNEQEG
jgi:hypothetical protein